MSMLRNKLAMKLAGKATLGASAALLAVALPSAGYAFVTLGTDSAADATDSSSDNFVAFTPADADPRLASFLAERNSGARMMRFTPAGAADTPANRSITVAVRVGEDASGALGSSSLIASSRAMERLPVALRVAPTRYNLGLARGYDSFAQSLTAPVAAAPALSRSLSTAEIPDLAEFTPTPGVAEEPSRFAARIELDEGSSSDNAAVSGERLTDQMLDVAGSYSITNNLDITAGVRYEQDRDLLPIPDVDQQDSQAVYVGTQFRF